MARLRSLLQGQPQVVQALTQAGEALSDTLLCRWLMSRGWDNVEATAACIGHHAHWRATLGATGRVDVVRWLRACMWWCPATPARLGSLHGARKLHRIKGATTNTGQLNG
jgi:hypothetical protein